MKARHLTSAIIQFLTEEKEVSVSIYTRDGNGDVTSKETFPIEMVVAHGKDVSIRCEKSKSVVVNN